MRSGAINERIGKSIIMVWAFLLTACIIFAITDSPILFKFYIATNAHLKVIFITTEKESRKFFNRENRVNVVINLRVMEK
jgi:hypothetical protein